eukprot:COSAG02_NODE_25655_length_652_cov_1.575045_1_plen_93_part_10
MVARLRVVLHRRLNKYQATSLARISGAWVQEKLQKTKELEELNKTIDDYEFAEEDEQLDMAPKLKALLQGFDYADDLDDPDGLRAAFEDFQDG